MKAKRFLSVLMAVMLMVSCFAIGASADSVRAIKPDGPYNLYVTLLSANNGTEITTDSSVTGEEKTITGRTPIVGYYFDIVQVKDDDTNPATATKIGSINQLSTNENGQFTFTTSTAGRYLVKASTNKTQPTSVTGDPVSFLVDLPMTDPTNLNAWLTDVYAYPKTVIDLGTPTVSKSVENEDNEKAGNGQSVDLEASEKATWTITATFPKAIADYKTYIISDEIDPRLIPVTGDDGNIKTGIKYYSSITGTDEVTSNIPVATITTDSSSGNKVLKVSYTADEIKKLPADGRVEISFQTTIDTSNENAIGKLIANHVDLTYQNNQSTSSTTISNHTESDKEDEDGSGDTEDENGEYPGDSRYDPAVWTGDIKATKVDGTNNSVLQDAEFALYKKVDISTEGAITLKTSSGDVTVVAKGTTSSDDNGKFSFVGLNEGEYYLVETKAPTGYTLLPDALSFEISVNARTGKLTAGTYVADNNTVKNIPKTDLPLTGGMGTTMFAIIGIAFVAVGGTFLFKSKKTKNVA